ncbi:MAG: crossover junction endodeoxyribonuclease [Desulfobacteraceae bacterium]|nr:MAG: crossover junction endodeoxyribonuclease [Desulfobacteraceae bacterium]
MLKCIGVDPGLADTGIGFVTGFGFDVQSYSFGTIQTSKSLPLPERLDVIFARLSRVLKDEKPDLMIVEDVFSLQKYPKSGIMLGKVIGVVLLSGFQSNIPVIEIPVREAKKILTGNGNANKIQLEKAVRSLLNHPEKIKPDHASDALALSLIGLYRYDVKCR